MSGKQYIIALAACAIAISFAVGAINYFADPFLLTGAPRISGVNQHKVDIGSYIRVTKAYHPLRNEHDVLLVGNSRIEMGLSPAHACFARAGQRVYNLGIPGASVSAQLAYASNLMAQQPIREVFLSVDFSDFAESGAAEGPGAAAWPFFSSLEYQPDGSRNTDYWQSRFTDYYRALFSLNSLVSSLKTLALQSVPGADRTERGFNPAYDFARATEQEGPGALFEQKFASIRANFGSRQRIRYDDGSLVSSFASLEEFLERATAKGIRVTLFSAPFHAQYMSLIEENRLQPVYADWFSSLVDLVGRFDPELVSLWDFTREPAYYQETIPAVGQKVEPLRWFWEASHYRRELGDLMLDAMLAESCGTEIVFGERRFP